MEECKAIILHGKPSGARYYALTPIDVVQQDGNKVVRYPKDSNYRIEPELELPPENIAPGTYTVHYYPTDRPTVPFPKTAICRFKISETPKIAAASSTSLGGREASLVDESAAGTSSEATHERLMLDRTQDANDFLRHRFAVGVQRDAASVSREPYYSREVRELLEHSREHRADLNQLSQAMVTAQKASLEQATKAAEQIMSVAESANRLVRSTIDTAWDRVEKLKVPPPPPPPPPPVDWMGGVNNLTNNVKDVMVAWLTRDKPTATPSAQPPIVQALMAETGQPAGSDDDTGLFSALESILAQSGDAKSAPKQSSASKSPPSSPSAKSQADELNLTPEAEKFRDLIKKNFRSREELDAVISTLVPELSKK